LIFSSNVEEDIRVSPLKSSNASMRPFSSVSQMMKEDSFAPKICSNSVRSMDRLSQTLLKEP
jgi:hypothetical protein